MNAQTGRIEEPVTTVVVDATTVQSEIPAEETVRVEEFKVNRDTLVTFIKNLLRKGNIRRIAVLNKQGERLIEIPLPVAVVGLGASAVVFPVAAIVATIVVLATNPTIVIERKE